MILCQIIGVTQGRSVVIIHCSVVIYSREISLPLEVLCDGSSSSVNDDDDDDDDAEDEQDRSSDPLDDEELMKVCNEQHRSYGVKLR
jgi:hypothetical protein